jgi:hypothetical protein
LSALIRNPVAALFDQSMAYPLGSLGARLRGMPSGRDLPWLARGDDAADDWAALQGALDAGLGPVHLPPGIYRVSQPLVIPDGGGLIGANAFWRTRSGYVYSGTRHTVIKYTGAAGANTCVVRASNKAVGVVGSDFDATGDGITDDLTSFTLRNLTIDANGLADFGLYAYRCGNQAAVDNVTVMRAVKWNLVGLGIFTGRWGHLGLYGAIGGGASIGYDLFGWGVESACFSFSASLHIVGNGTGATYVKGTATDLDNPGGQFSVGRGSHLRMTLEGNVGRACLLTQYNMAAGGGGPNVFELSYVEGNGDGPYIDYRASSGLMKVCAGFIHPGNGGSLAPQDITIEAKTDAGVVTADEGPADSSRWLVLEGLAGASSVPTNFDVKSNTNRYYMRGCGRNVGFTNRLPAGDDYIPTERQVSASCWFTASAAPTIWQASNGTLARTGVGTFQFTYARPFRTAGVYAPSATVSLSAALNTSVRVINHSETSITVRTYDAGGAAADTGDRISLQVAGQLAYQP